MGAAIPPEIKGAAAVSVPYDLELSCRNLLRGFSRVYDRHFLATLRAKAEAKLVRHPKLFDARALAGARTLYQFDDVVTAPVHGFADAHDYYSRSSSIHFLARIAVPTLLLSAIDDPFLPPKVLHQVRAIAASNGNLQVEFVRHGGHVGFVSGRVPWRPRYYAEERIGSFLAAVSNPQLSHSHSHSHSTLP